MRIRTGHLRRKLAKALLILAMLSATANLGPYALATGAIGTAAGFEDDDGNLRVDSTTDWNSFSPVTWNGTAPNQNGSKTLDGWQFTGNTDNQKSKDDSGFAGGTKQDDDCAKVIGSSAPNKDDLKRVYIAHKTVDGNIYLELGWVRIPQNTTSPSAHVGFEFNQATSGACPTTSDGLVHRTAGDILIVYDFEGGATDTPVISVRKWVLTGACEVGNSSPPCWGTAQNLTDAGFAEAKVNTTVAVTDTVAPSNDTLGLNEFGEAGINLTGAGIFAPNVCTAFGKAFGVSRSSGNSGNAQMEDLVGPFNVSITNCGNLVVKKVTVPSPDTTDTSFDFTLNGPNPPNASLPKSFSLTNGQTNTTQLFAGSNYSVTETVPADWDLTGATCDNGSGTLSGSTLNGITVGTSANTTCTFTNTLQLGAIQVTKESSKDSTKLLGGAVFSVAGISPSRRITTTVSGTACTDGLPFGSYTVTEILAPTGYAIDNPSGVSVAVDHSASCSSGTPNAPPAFTDSPLTNITVTVASQVAGGTQSSISCVDESNNDIGNSPQPPSGFADPVAVSATGASGVKPGTYTCTIVVDP